MNLGLNGKRALVSAASSGLGYAIARALAVEGCTVALCSRSKERIDAAADRIRAGTGATVVAAQCDVTDGEALAGWIDDVAAAMGGLEIVVANAAGPRHGSFADLSLEDWDAAYALTLRSAVVTARASGKHLGAGGALLFMTSSSVKEPKPLLVLSNALRAGVASLAKTLANEWGERGVRVNHLIPGRIATERLSSYNESMATSESVGVEEVMPVPSHRSPWGGSVRPRNTPRLRYGWCRRPPAT